MNLFHPQSPEHFAQRHSLLQHSLRPEPLPFPIEDEYPLVLTRENTEFSYCAAADEKIIAHFNLWPRTLRDAQNSFRVGLVGNVATDSSVRGQGIMTQCFQLLDEIAEQQQLDALVLWSDLTTFYQKLNFHALGNELRFTFNRQGEKIAHTFLPIAKANITANLASRLLACRFALPSTLDRNPEEMAALLHIPETTVFAKIVDSEPTAFGIVGKGYDMGGVIHEWGANSATELLDLTQSVTSHHDWPACMILSPGSLPQDWRATLEAAADATEEHPMALVKTKNSALRRCLESGFIWGLDSI